MKRRTMLTAVLAVLALLLSYTVAVGQELPPGPTPVSRSSFEVTAPPAAFDTINLVLDFAPGAWTPMHTHGGEGIVTVLEGTITYRAEDGQERTVAAGEHWLEHPGHLHAAGNDTDTNARVVATFLLPKGAELTTVEGTESDAELPPGPTLVYRTSFEVTEPPAHFDLINLVLDFAPGAWTPVHTHGGQGIVTVLEGELTHRPQGGAEQRLGAGESFIETPGHAHAAGNDTDTNARVLFTILLPKGAELTTVVQDSGQPTLPKTGVIDNTSPEFWLLVLSVGALTVITGWFIQRKVRHS